MSFRAEIVTRTGWNWTDGAIDDDNLRYEKQLLDGNANNRAQGSWHLTDQTLADGESVQLDLTALLRTVLGDTLTTAFDRIKCIHIVSALASVGTIIVGNADYDCWYQPFGAAVHTVEVPPDSPLVLANRREGWPVRDTGASSSSSSSGEDMGESGASRMLKLEASGGAVTYDISIIGTLTAPAAASSSSSGS